MKTIAHTLCAAVASALLASAGHAAPLFWTLEDALLDDGGTATGRFTYDADTNTFSGISITTTAGTTLPGGIFSVFLEGDSETLAIVPAGPLAGAPILQLIFDAPLTSAGGFVGLANIFLPAASSFEATCVDGDCLSADFGRSFVDGVLVASPVPVPAAAWLLGGALGVLPLVRRRRG